MSLSELLSELKKIPNSAVNIIDIRKENDNVYISESKIVPGENGLFASRDIRKGENVVIYFGDILTWDEFIKEYTKDKNIMKWAREGNSFWIDGRSIWKTKNRNTYGAFVNDISKPKDTKMKSLKKYAKTQKKCNLVSVKTGDFPIYIANKNIKKNSELSVHYGIGYWLLNMGVSTETINKKFKKIIKRTYK